ncbi:trehalose-phosphatase [Chloroflexota bacterium]
MPPLFEYLDSIESLLTLSPLGLMTDIDGTISFTAPTPAEAQVTPVCRRSLELLSGHLELVAVVSGRPVAQMRKILDLDGVVYSGNHGFERWVEGEIELCNDAGRYSVLIEDTLQDLKPLSENSGIYFENKGSTASIHYRLCRDHEAARKQIFAALANSPSAGDLRITPGRVAVDLHPPIEVNKGSAVRDLIREYQLRAAFYLGDDVSDLDAFRAIKEAETPDFHGICIGVIDEETLPGVEAGADFTLYGVSETERFLEWLATVV